MKKQILALSLILSPAFIHAMENNYFFPISCALHSYLSALFAPRESKLVSDLRANKNAFEDTLQLNKWEKPLKYPLITFFGTYHFRCY